MDSRLIKVLSVHWGFSIGGVAQYAAILERVTEFASIELETVCVLNRRRHIDEKTLAKLGGLSVIERTGPWDVRWVGGLRKAIREKNPDLIITHGFNGHFAAYVARPLGGRPARYIASYHGEYHPPTRLKRLVAGLYNGFTEFYMRNVAVSIASVADYCKNHLVSKGVDSDKITVIHNGIPEIHADESMDQLRRDLGIPEDRLIVGTVSRLDPEKGLVYLLEAFADVVTRHSDALLLVIGTGSQEQDLRRLAISLGIEHHVRFAGFRSDAWKCLGLIDVFALPSLAEYHSIGLLEAMRAGKAIVATNVGGNTESVRDSKEGIIVDPADSGQLSRAVGTLLDSEELRHKYGQQARKRYEDEFREDVMVKRCAMWLAEAARQ